MDKKRIIEFQLDRELDVLPDIAGECPFSMPAVLRVVPFNEKRGVFPTIYWLSCPYLVKEVFSLEDEGLIGRLTARLKEDKEFKQKMDRCHERYARQRLSLMNEEEIKKIKDVSGDMYNVLVNSGVGGIRDKGGIKCLHAHLADYLINGDNPAGEIVWSYLHWPEKCELCAEGVEDLEISSD